MRNLFINCTNHPSTAWGEKQRKCALEMGEIRDYNFPNVSPRLKEEEIEKLSKKVVEELELMQPAVVLCQGEFTLTYAIVKGLKELGITVVSACSERVVKEEKSKDGFQKTSYFEFTKFREY